MPPDKISEQLKKRIPGWHCATPYGDSKFSLATDGRSALAVRGLRDRKRITLSEPSALVVRLP